MKLPAAGDDVAIFERCVHDGDALHCRLLHVGLRVAKPREDARDFVEGAAVGSPRIRHEQIRIRMLHVSQPPDGVDRPPQHGDRL
jgi:hypothetical protein